MQHEGWSDLAAHKQALRKELLAQRLALAPPAGSPEALAAGAQVAGLLAEAGLLRGQIALYLAFGHEFDPAPIGELARQRGAALCYPRVAGGDPPALRFHAIEGPEHLRRGPMGVMEPDPGEPVVPLSALDLFIVPGLGFDDMGHRLGYGRGYYDGALRAHPSALRIAPCYPFQLRAAIPHDERDEPLDLIATPSGLRATQARAGRWAARGPLPVNGKEDIQ